MRALFLAVAFLIPLGVSWADTIVLKNGRRIYADSVVEQGDQVLFDRGSGQVSLPRELVERIEKGGAAPARRSSTAPADSAEGPEPTELVEQILAPQAGFEEILQGGVVNEDRLKEWAALAARGEQERQNAVNAYLVAASFEARQRKLAASARFRLGISRNGSTALLTIGYLTSRQHAASAASKTHPLRRRTFPQRQGLRVWLPYGGR